MQNRYFTADEVSLPSPVLVVRPPGFVLLFGLAALALDRESRASSLDASARPRRRGLPPVPRRLSRLPRRHPARHPPRPRPHRVSVRRRRRTGRHRPRAPAHARAGYTSSSNPRWPRTAIAIGAIVLVFAVGQTVVRDIPFLKEQRDARYPHALIDTFERGTDGDYDGFGRAHRPARSQHVPSDVRVQHVRRALQPSRGVVQRPRRALDVALRRIRSRRVRLGAHAQSVRHRSTTWRCTTVGGKLAYDYLGDAFPCGVIGESLSFSTVVVRQPIVHRDGRSSTSSSTA